MSQISMPVKSFTTTPSPNGDPSLPSKARFLVRIGDIPAELTEWMSTNPREQNLGSPVAKAIAASMREDTHDFHLKNRGVLLSAEDVVLTDGGQEVTIIFSDPALHGNVDGGHTLRLILAAQESGEVLPEQYVEFEVITGLTVLIPIAEARNTSVALDMKSMEAMKGSFDVLKDILGGVTVGGDRFFDRVELKMNEQLEADNKIDIRLLIGIILMFNKNVIPDGIVKNYGQKSMPTPHTLYGRPETVLQKYLDLGGGDPEVRQKEIEAMSPILPDLLTFWDTVEREFAMVNEKAYSKLPFATRLKNPMTLFSNQPLPYAMPRSVTQPVVAAIHDFVDIGKDGAYFWSCDPFAFWEANKARMVSTFIDNIKTQKNDPSRTVKYPIYWHSLALVAELYRANTTVK